LKVKIKKGKKEKWYIEDYLFPIAYPLIKKIHNIKEEKIIHHAYIEYQGKNVECDVAIIYRSSRNTRKLLIIELKEHDLDKLIIQLIVRRKFANLIYGVINKSYDVIMNSLLSNRLVLNYVSNMGLGLIAIENNKARIVFPSIER